jgi:hypothetical protein
MWTEGNKQVTGGTRAWTRDTRPRHTDALFREEHPAEPVRRCLGESPQKVLREGLCLLRLPHQFDRS